MELNAEYYIKQKLFTGNGIPKELIQEECLDYAEDLYCGICRNLCFNPITCQKCQNIYCKKCTEPTNKSFCVICPKNTEPKTTSVNQILLKILRKIKLACLYPLCTQKLKYEEFEPHINSCEFLPYQCVSENCNFIGKESEIKEHIKICENLLLKCGYQNCKERIKRKFFKEHETECGERLINCLFCKESVRRIDLEKHVDKCRYICFICTPCKGLCVENIIKITQNSKSITNESNKENGNTIQNNASLEEGNITIIIILFTSF